jgi:hypothetical protein
MSEGVAVLVGLCLGYVSCWVTICFCEAINRTRNGKEIE